MHYRLLIPIFLTALPIHAEGVPDKVDYNRDVRPILSNSCYACHGPDSENNKSDLRLDSRESALHEHAIIPGDGKASELIKRILTTDPDDEMPPPDAKKPPLNDLQKQILTKWIDQGAKFEVHWSYKKVAKPEGSSIDEIVATELKQRDLNFSDPAEKSTLLRRVFLDATGLPPTPEESREFLADTSGDAYEKLVDRLLATPAYGENMATYWLDAVRFADTVGYHGDQSRDASPFRDYVIHAFNSNKSYKDFVTEQIAGDLIPDATIEQKIASGYNRLNQISSEGGIQDAEYLKKYQSERIRTTSTAFLGSTLACAECHDHKFDPFTAKDFYSMGAFFADILEKGAWNGDGSYQEKDISEYLADPLVSEKDNFGPSLEVSNRTFMDNADAYNDDGKPDMDLDGKRYTPITISAKPRETRVLNRGNWMDTTGEIVQPATPAFLDFKVASTPDKRLTRLDLANWIVSKENPLTARTFVNRRWAQFFGSPLSNTPEDLGHQGEYPVYPDLLEFLAYDFMDSGWDIKHLIRSILVSKTYRQSSRSTDELKERDPGNRFLAHQSPRRLIAENIRDNALAVSGLLVRKVGGRSVNPYQPDGYYQALNFPRREYTPDTGENQHRRGLYTHWQRTFLHPMLLAFDAPGRDECIVARPHSNTPLQSLALLNDPSILETSAALAQSLLQESADTSTRLDSAYFRILMRKPSEQEKEIVGEFLKRESARFEADPASASEFLGDSHLESDPAIPFTELAAWTSVSRALLNLHETITRF